MLETLIHTYLTEQLRNYIRKNALALEDVGKSYCNKIPSFLKNRPPFFVKHCMEKMSLAEAVDSFDVVKLSSNHFKVKSQELSVKPCHYIVKLDNGNGLPHCDCHSWCWQHLPCKHMFAVFNSFPGTASWDSFPENYRNSPFFCIDMKFIGENEAISTDARSTEVSLLGPVTPDNADDGDLVQHVYNVLPPRKRAQGAKEVAALCRERLSVLKDTTYLCDDASTLRHMLGLLNEAYSFMQSKLPRESGLPLELTKTLKGKTILRKKTDQPKHAKALSRNEKFKRIPKRKGKPQKRVGSSAQRKKDITHTGITETVNTDVTDDLCVIDDGHAEVPTSHIGVQNGDCDGSPRGGLLNPSGKNLCFANSLLQCIVKTDIHGVLAVHKVCNISECFTCKFKQFIDDRPASAEDLCRSMNGIWQEYQVGEQQDSHEFWTKIMAEVNTVCFGWYNSEIYSMTTSMKQQSFGGLLESKLTCNRCSAITCSQEPFFDISLPVQKAVSVKEALENFFSEEEITFSCMRCMKKNVQATKATKLLEVPQYIVLHLKRFSSGLRKDRRWVEINEEIQLCPYVDKNKEHSDKARLFGMLIHHGNTLNYGHYYAYVRYCLQWYVIDDMKIRRISWNEIKSCLDQPYMLFYKALPRPYTS